MRPFKIKLKLQVLKREHKLMYRIYFAQGTEFPKTRPKHLDPIYTIGMRPFCYIFTRRKMQLELLIFT
jgi:hypothetical protein